MASINKTQYAILGILSSTPSSGYDIKKFFDGALSYFWKENFGHIYPVLSKLEAEGLVIKKSYQEEGKPSKNIYTITEQGRNALHLWLLDPIEPPPARLELLLKLTFARYIPPENMIRELQSILEKHTKCHSELLLEKEKFLLNEKMKKSDGFPYWLSSIQYGIYDTEFRIKWLKETIETIKTHFGIEEV